MTDDEIVDGYVKHVDHVPSFPPPTSADDVAAAVTAIKASTQTDDYFWAWAAVHDLIETDPDRAWRVILAALKQCAPKLEYIIGAGPIEDLLVKYPREFATRVVSELRENERFRAAFGVVRFSTEFTHIDDANYFTETLASAVGSEFAPHWRIAEPEDD